MRGPTFRVLVSEAAWNMWAARARTGLLVLLVAASLVAVVMAEAREVNRIRRYQATLRAEGFNSLAIQPTPGLPAQLTAGDCSALEVIAGVTGAVWLGESRDVRLYSSAGPQIRLTPVGGSVVAVLGSLGAGSFDSWQGSQIFVDTTSLATSTRAAAHRLILFDGDELVDATVFATPLAALGGGLTGQGVEVAGVSSDLRVISTCLVLTQNGFRDLVESSVRTALPPSEGYASTWVLAGASQIEEPDDVFMGRPSRFAWLYATAALSLIWAVAMRLRRNDIAVYSICGFGGPATALILVLESMAVSYGGYFLGSLTLASASRISGQADRTSMWVGQLSGLRLLSACSAILVLISVQIAYSVGTTTSAALKDR